LLAPLKEPEVDVDAHEYEGLQSTEDGELPLSHRALLFTSSSASHKETHTCFDR
jgi:hypothetical protein